MSVNCQWIIQGMPGTFQQRVDQWLERLPARERDIQNIRNALQAAKRIGIVDPLWIAKQSFEHTFLHTHERRSPLARSSSREARRGLFLDYEMRSVPWRRPWKPWISRSDAFDIYATFASLGIDEFGLPVAQMALGLAQDVDALVAVLLHQKITDQPAIFQDSIGPIERDLQGFIDIFSRTSNAAKHKENSVHRSLLIIRRRRKNFEMFRDYFEACEITPSVASQSGYFIRSGLVFNMGSSTCALLFERDNLPDFVQFAPDVLAQGIKIHSLATPPHSMKILTISNVGVGDQTLKIFHQSSSGAGVGIAKRRPGSNSAIVNSPKATVTSADLSCLRSLRSGDPNVAADERDLLTQALEYPVLTQVRLNSELN